MDATNGGPGSSEGPRGSETAEAPTRPGVAAYAAEVRSGSFPGPEHVYSIDDDELRTFEAGLDETL